MILDSTNGKFLQSEDMEELSLESQSLILEGLMLDNLNSEELLEFLCDPSETRDLINGQILTEKSIVRLDRKAKLSKAQKIAIYTIARQKKDPLFRRLLTLWRMERFIDARLFKKYGNPAMRAAKKAMSSATANPKPSKTMKKVIDRAVVRQKRRMNAIKDTKANQMLNRVAMK
jgi:hypothetical protein